MLIAQINESGDTVFTMSDDGRPRTWHVERDGSLTEITL